MLKVKSASCGTFLYLLRFYLILWHFLDNEITIYLAGGSVMKMTLKDTSEFYSGTGFPTVYQGSASGKYPFYKVGDISKNVQQGYKFLEICDNYIDDDILKQIKGVLIPKNSIAFAKIGEAFKLNRRAITKQHCLVDNNAVAICPNQAILDVDYSSP